MKRFLALFMALAMTFSVVMPSVATAYESVEPDSSALSVQESTEQSGDEASASASEEAPTPEVDRSQQEEPAQKDEKKSDEGDSSAQKEEKGEKQEKSAQKDEKQDEKEEKKSPEKTIKASLKTVDGVKYTLTLSYDEKAGIPDGTKLSVVELNEALTEEEKEEKENKDRPFDTEKFLSKKALEQEIFDLRQGLKVRKKDYVLFNKLLDLSLTHDGKTVQPKAPVTITLETDAVEEGASDALEVAFYDEKATEKWEKQRKKLVKEQKKQIRSGKLAPEDAKRFEEKIYTPAEVTNETEPKKGAKISFEAEKLTRMGVAGVAQRLKSWKAKGETVCVYGPKGLKAKVTTVSQKNPTAGIEKVGAFSVKPNEKKNPKYDVQFWVGGVPQQYETGDEDEDGLVTQSVQDTSSGVVVSTLKSGKAKKELIGTEGTEAPVAIKQGDEIGVTYDTGLRKQSVEAEDVSVSGMLPKNADVTANDMLWRYSRPEEVKKDIKKGDAETLAAYNITISGRKGEFQPEDGETVSVSIQNVKIDESKKVEIWHLKDDGSVEVIRDFKVDGDSVRFDAAGFSVYMVVQYTVDFHWGGYTYNLPGGSDIFLSTLLRNLDSYGMKNTENGDFSEDVNESLQLNGSTTLYPIDQLLDDMGQIEDVTFSNPELVKVEKKESEQAENDWLLSSLAAFDTEETLSIELVNGDVVEITVTDAQDVCQLIKNGTTTKYTSLKSALDAAKGNCTIEMLVPEYELEWTTHYSVDGGVDLTLTTAASVGENCIIYRGKCVANTGYTNFFWIDNATFTLKNITLDGRVNKNATEGHAVHAGTRGPFFWVHDIRAKLIVEDGTIMQYGRSAESGTSGNAHAGAIDIIHGTLEIKGGIIRNCRSLGHGGAIHLHPGSDTNLIFSGGMIEDCECWNDDGGAICVESKMTWTGGTIRNCKASGTGSDATAGLGGAIYMKSGEITMGEGAAIEDCEAKRGGGAIYITGGTIVLKDGGHISGCKTTTGNGGAIYMNSGTIKIEDGGYIRNCHADSGNGGAAFVGYNRTTASEFYATGNSEISGCSSVGGSVYIETYHDGTTAQANASRQNPNTRVYFSGTPQIWGNIGGDVDLTEFTDEPSYRNNFNNIIHSTGLESSAEVGIKITNVYHDTQDENFGTADSAAAATSGLIGFVNSLNKDGNGNYLRGWPVNYNQAGVVKWSSAIKVQALTFSGGDWQNASLYPDSDGYFGTSDFWKMSIKDNFRSSYATANTAFNTLNSWNSGYTYSFAMIGDKVVTHVYCKETSSTATSKTYTWYYYDENDVEYKFSSDDVLSLYYYSDPMPVNVKWVVKGSDGTFTTLDTAPYSETKTISVSSTGWSDKASVYTVYGKNADGSENVVIDKYYFHYIGIGASTAGSEGALVKSGLTNFYIKNSESGLKYATSNQYGTPEEQLATGVDTVYMIYSPEPPENSTYLDIVNNYNKPFRIHNTYIGDDFNHMYDNTAVMILDDEGHLAMFNGNTNVLNANTTLHLVLLGAANEKYKINGGFDDPGEKIGASISDADGTRSETIKDTARWNTSDILKGTLRGEGEKATIIFGDAYICKIGTERFSTLRDAVKYAEDNSLTTATIEMLVDYPMPADDTVTIRNGYKITITTANKTGDEGYVYTGEGDKATIKRGFTPEDDKATNNNQLFTIIGAETELHFTNIVIDGDKEHYSGGKGSLVYVNGDGNDVPALFVDADATLQNAKSAREGGGAVFVDHGTVTVAKDGSIENCVAEGGNGGAILAQSTGAVLNIQGTLSGNISTNGGAIKTGKGAIINIYPDASMTDNAVTGSGGAIYASGTVNMTGGEISGNKGAKGAGLYLDSDGSASFSGKSVVYDNKAGENQRNVEFSGNNNTSVNLSGALDATAKIGVYAPDGHNKAGESFGTRGTIIANLNKFINDRNDTLYGVKQTDDLLYWSNFIARVSNDGGTTWTYHEWLINAEDEPEQQNGKTIKKGAFDEANTLTGDVIIETLKETAEIDGLDRYTLTEGFTFNKAGITGLTLRTTTGAEFRSILTKNQNAASMITVSDVQNFSTFTVENLIFEGGKDAGKSQTDGGILNIRCENGVLRNCDFNHAYINAGNLSAKDATGSRGGAVFKNAGNLTVSGCVFTDCRAETPGTAGNTGNGGALALHTAGKTRSGKLTIEGTRFVDCFASRHGGAVLDENKGTSDIRDTEFENCTSEKNSSGAYYIGSAITQIDYTGCTFTGCKCINGSGGAIYDNSSSPASIKDCTFTGCSAKSHGGAIYNKGALTVDNSGITGASFDNCSSDSGHGGAIYSDSALNVTGATFHTCSAQGGGAIWAGNTTVLTNCVFGDKNDQTKACTSKYINSSESEAGAVNVRAGGLTINNTTAGEIGVYYSTSDGDTAGAIYINGGTMTVNNSDGGIIAFEHCKCLKGNSGGAIYVLSGAFQAENNNGTIRFLDCSTEGGDYGAGAIGVEKNSVSFNNNSGTLEFIDCYAKSSKCGSGAIYAHTGFSATGNTGSIKFEHCYAPNGNGGAMYVAGGNCEVSGSGTVKFTSSESSTDSCYAKTNGGAIYHAGTGTMTIENGTFTECKGGTGGSGGVVYTVSSDATFNNCDFKAGAAETDAVQTAKLGGAIYHTNTAGSISLIDTGIYGYLCTANGGQGGAVWSNGKEIYLADVIIKNCKAKTIGGGIYSEAKTVGIHNTLTVTQNSIDNTTVTNAGGVYFKPEDTVITVTSDTDEAYIWIYGNTLSNNQESNLRMGIGAPGIEVKGIKTGGLTGKVGVVNPAVMDRWFGRSTDYRVCGDPTGEREGKIQEVEMFLDDTNTYFAKYQGILQRRLIWAPLPNDGICKITDENGNLLYYDFGDGREEAVFGTLADAFGAYAEWADDPATFTRIDGTTAVKRLTSRCWWPAIHRR